MAATTEKRHTNGIKRERHGDADATKRASQRPAKKAKLLDNTDDEESGADEGGASLKVNEDYARRFEYNKKREEQHRRMFSCAPVPSHAMSLTVGSRGKVRQGQSAAAGRRP